MKTIYLKLAGYQDAFWLELYIYALTVLIITVAFAYGAGEFLGL